MLQTLQVKNLAIVENITVEWEPGLNVVTGETGAGKSILIGALGLILGERAEKSLIRAGEDACGVQASFALADTAPIDRILEELGLPPCDGGKLILRRIVSAAGGNKVLVNDSPATVQTLARIGELLVDMHGPHDHQSLLNRDFQMELLDAFAHLAPARGKYDSAYREALDLEQQRKALDGDDRQVAQQIDFLTHQVRELESAGLTLADEAELEEEHAAAANAQEILRLADAARNALGEDETSAFNQMTFVQQRLEELSRVLPEADEWKKEAASVAVQIQELVATISSRAERVETDPNRLQWLDDRISLVNNLKRKYGGSVENALAFLDEARGRLCELESRGERIAELERQIANARQVLSASGGELSKARKKAASGLAKAITAELKELGFSHGQFLIELQAGEPRPSGLDEIEFGFAPNPGEPARPLRLIASSGEISRVMLAIKAVLAQHDRIPVLVFDEIDANVGGEMGLAIGAKLSAVAGTRQVLCITHLPQVAVQGSTHFSVVKEVRDGRTRTAIQRLGKTDRVEEVARMLGGRELTSVTLRHAREMLKLG